MVTPEKWSKIVESVGETTKGRGGYEKENYTFFINFLTHVLCKKRECVKH